MSYFQSPYHKSKIPSPSPFYLIWHDEQNTSWTYCERFIINIDKYSTNKYMLYRWTNKGLNSNFIGTFKTPEIAKSIANIIITAENI